MHYSMGRHVALVKLGMDPRLLGAGLGAGLGGAAGALGGGEDNRLVGGLAGAAVGGGLGALTPAILNGLVTKAVTNQSGRGPMYTRELGEEARAALRNEAKAYREANPTATYSMGRYTPPETGDEVLRNYMTGSVRPVPPGYDGFDRVNGFSAP